MSPQNNNPNTGPQQPQPQPMQGQPQMQQMQPQMQQQYPNQQYPQGQWGQQPMYQQPMRPPKPPMDPAKKKKIIKLSIIGGIILILGIAAAIIVPIILRIDWEEANTAANRVNNAIVDFQGSTNCAGVIRDIESTRISKADYTKYVANCRETIRELRSGVEELERTGARRDAEVREAWEPFKESFDRTIPLYEKLLPAYEEWFTFSADWRALTSQREWWLLASDDKVREIYKPLTESENETLSKYGKARLALKLPYVNAEREYQAELRACRNAVRWGNLVCTSTTNLDRSPYTDEDREWRRRVSAKKAVLDDTIAKLDAQRGDRPDLSNTRWVVDVDLTIDEFNFRRLFSPVRSAISSRYLEQRVDNRMREFGF